MAMLLNLVKIQKALGLRSASFFASASFRNMFSLFLINRRAYLNLDLHFTCWSCTGPCLGLPALIHICLISQEVSYTSSTYSAHPGL